MNHFRCGRGSEWKYLFLSIYILKGVVYTGTHSADHIRIHWNQTATIDHEWVYDKHQYHGEVVAHLVVDVVYSFCVCFWVSSFNSLLCVCFNRTILFTVHRAPDLVNILLFFLLFPTSFHFVRSCSFSSIWLWSFPSNRTGGDMVISIDDEFVVF